MNDRSKKEAEILRNRRKELGLTQMEAAVRAGLVLQQYQRFEYGNQRLSNVNMITALKVCAALELDPYCFVSNSGEMYDTDKK